MGQHCWSQHRLLGSQDHAGSTYEHQDRMQPSSAPGSFKRRPEPSSAPNPGTSQRRPEWDPSSSPAFSSPLLRCTRAQRASAATALEASVLRAARAGHSSASIANSLHRAGISALEVSVLRAAGKGRPSSTSNLHRADIQGVKDSSCQGESDAADSLPSARSRDIRMAVDGLDYTISASISAIQMRDQMRLPSHSPSCAVPLQSLPPPEPGYADERGPSFTGSSAITQAQLFAPLQASSATRSAVGAAHKPTRPSRSTCSSFYPMVDATPLTSSVV